MDDDFSFAAPPFDAAAALVTLRRQLRELRPLAERGARFEVRGQSVIELQAGDGAIQARLARRPARSSEWSAQTIDSTLALRQFVDRVKKQLPLWERDE
jgi:hypothetical protein